MPGHAMWRHSGSSRSAPAYAPSTCSQTRSLSHTAPISASASIEQHAVVPSVANTTNGMRPNLRSSYSPDFVMHMTCPVHNTRAANRCTQQRTPQWRARAFARAASSFRRSRAAASSRRRSFRPSRRTSGPALHVDVEVNVNTITL